MNLDSDEDDFEQATDLTTQEVPRVTISNITEDKVGNFEDDASDVGKEVIAASAPAPAPVAETAPKTTPAATTAVAEAEPVDVSDAPDTVQDESDDEVGGDYDDLPF